MIRNRWDCSHTRLRAGAALGLLRRNGRRAFPWFAWACAAALSSATVSGQYSQPSDTAELARRSVVVANASLPESVELARFYCERRGIPAQNLVLLPAPETERVTRSQFVEALWNPLLRALMDRGWITGTASAGADSYGRMLLADGTTNLFALVTVFGIPVRVEHDPAMTVGPETDGAAVDSELAMLAYGGYPLLGPVPNPFFRGASADGARQLRTIFRVGRIDGPDADAARSLVESALDAERTGAWGRAYIDSGGVYPMGNAWLGAAGDSLEKAGFPVARETEPTVFKIDDRFDAPLFYLGWYRAAVEGPFLRPGFRFRPGAVALHIYSFSADPLRGRGGAWAGGLVARGAALVCGNVNEPYLQRSHRPDILVAALLDGATAVEAAWAALPCASWYADAFGDPLYRPFPGGRHALLARAERSDNPYAALLAANLCPHDDFQTDRASALLLRSWERLHSPVVALALLSSSSPEARAGAAEKVVASHWASVADEPRILRGAIALLESYRLRSAADRLQALLSAPADRGGSGAPAAPSPTHGSGQ